MQTFKILILCGIFVTQPAFATATALTAEDLASDYINEDLGISIKIPHTWTYETSGEGLIRAREIAQDLTSRVLDVPKELVQKIASEGSDKSILIRMKVTHSAIPAAQITTRSLANVENAPKSALEHLTRYMQFLKSMTRIDSMEPIAETELNGSPCAHVTYDTQIVLEGYTYLARYDVYSFWRADRTIDLTIINDRDGAFKTQNEMDFNTILNSVRIDV